MPNVTLLLKYPEKEQTKPQISRRQAIIKIGVEINDAETRKSIEKINKKSRTVFLKKYKNSKPLTRLRKRERSQNYK